MKALRFILPLLLLSVLAGCSSNNYKDTRLPDGAKVGSVVLLVNIAFFVSESSDEGTIKEITPDRSRFSVEWDVASGVHWHSVHDFKEIHLIHP